MYVSLHQSARKLHTFNRSFSGNVGHDPHILYTLSALQILALIGELDRVDKDKVAEWVISLQQEDGSFFGDKWGEVDTRFSYCAISCLSILGKKEKFHTEVNKAAEFVLRYGELCVALRNTLSISTWPFTFVRCADAEILMEVLVQSQVQNHMQARFFVA